ncbi:MAG: hypothetical protein P8Z33_02155 [Gammaproteobacteria bacterium]
MPGKFDEICSDVCEQPAIMRARKQASQQQLLAQKGIAMPCGSICMVSSLAREGKPVMHLRIMSLF